MRPEQLQMLVRPSGERARMLVAFSGWMDGGEVSTGALSFLLEELGATKVAAIDPEDFYVMNFPGSMELTSLFRPEIELEQGLLRQYDEPVNEFFYNDKERLVLFRGKEPHLKWGAYTDCVFQVAQEFDVREMYFIGSVAGLVPHTREPRIISSVSDAKLKERLTQYHIKFSDYSGPGSIVNKFLQRAAQSGVDMCSLIAEMPAYVQGRNPRCIEAILKRLAALLGLEINLENLRRMGDVLEKRIDRAVEEQGELGEHIKVLEENYDKEMFDADMGDLQEWLKNRGIRLD